MSVISFWAGAWAVMNLETGNLITESIRKDRESLLSDYAGYLTRPNYEITEVEIRWQKKKSIL